jgi:hypothetical protein
VKELGSPITERASLFRTEYSIGRAARGSCGRTMMQSLCETCQNTRIVRTARSRFLLCELSVTDAAYPKYPPQPIIRCDGFQPRDEDKQGDSPGELA